MYAKEKTFRPSMNPADREKFLHKWHKAVRMCQGWEDDSK
jgi:glycerol kinase